ncbi:MAG: hypothetical protein QW272_09675 [Candidatus Methanomethylicaceae archaeon]
MSEIYGEIDYYKIGGLKILSENKDIDIGGGVAINLPSDSGVPIFLYKFKTISMKGDYAFDVKVQVSDDGITWDDYYSTSLTANTLCSYSFEEDFFYIRVNVRNPDTVSHRLFYIRIKGRRR